VAAAQTAKLTYDCALRIPNRRSAGGMVMRGAKPVERMPPAKLLGASMGFAEPHGHVGRQQRRCVAERCDEQA
jgi:hypothetical protein